LAPAAARASQDDAPPAERARRAAVPVLVLLAVNALLVCGWQFLPAVRALPALWLLLGLVLVNLYLLRWLRAAVHTGTA
jgi:hypothetical protein